MKKVGLLLAFVSCIIFITACNPSKTEVAKETEKSVKAVFSNQTTQHADNETKMFSYYKPDDLVIEKKGDNNIIFQNGQGDIYILFVNTNEDKLSQLNYKAEQKRKTDKDVLKTFKTKNQFVYVFVRPLSADLFELIVDAGGVKMSTKTTLSELADNAKMMAEVVHSVKINK